MNVSMFIGIVCVEARGRCKVSSESLSAEFLRQTLPLILEITDEAMLARPVRARDPPTLPLQCRDYRYPLPYLIITGALWV